MNAEVRPVPRRVRPYEGTQLRRTPFMKLMMGRDPSPTRDEYNEMVAALWQGDAPMDTLLDWMYEIGPREGRKLYEQALERGIDSVADAPKPLRDFFRMIESTPSWVDHALIEDGVSFIHRTGLAGPYVLRDFALMGGYLLSGFNHALVMTGALNKGAAQRIAETGKWWVDCTEHDGLSRFGVGFKTTLRVRMVHGMVRRHLPTRPEWDNSEWGIPVNQTDMLATYLAFGPIMLVGMRAMGIPVTPHESRAVMHLWKYAAWLMGVEEKWLVDGERDGLVRLYQTFLTQSRADWTSAELGRALSEEPLQRQFFPGGSATLRGFNTNGQYGPTYWRGRGEIATGFAAARLGLFSDFGWVGRRDAFTFDRSMVSVGAGVSFLDGLVRIDAARAVRGRSRWKLHLYLDGLF